MFLFYTRKSKDLVCSLQPPNLPSSLCVNHSHPTCSPTTGLTEGAASYRQLPEPPLKDTMMTSFSLVLERGAYCFKDIVDVNVYLLKAALSETIQQTKL